ncbi:hypothetical protein Q8F55_000342 [Vanrija albida]|uniref:Uncharacterized protein n=1 Tax=Vanrija albida TaxID=181172 RepID=A0ABR3QD71_9TREE
MSSEATPARGDKPRRPRPSGHRKSLSTSALAVMSGTPPLIATPGGPGGGRSGASPVPPLPVSRAKKSALPPLPPVKESMSSADIAGLARMPSWQGTGAQQQAEAADAASALNDLRSLRSTGRRRQRALAILKTALVSACSGKDSVSSPLVDLLELEPHTPLLALLGRHTASLAKRASSSSLPVGDDLARHLSPEIDLALSVLQGLSLLGSACKKAVGERWAMEMFLDLLLLLRAQQPAEGEHPTVYVLLDLLFCILVDSPVHARTFEELSGLEAVTRVLRGTGVAKDVRMKCCEFLYFYLLPEGATAMPDLAAKVPMSVLAGLSPGAALPPSLDSSTSSAATANGPSLPPSPNRSRLTSEAPRAASPDRRWADLDLPFVPETPRKPPKPSLGFQTPATNRRASNLNSSASSNAMTPAATPALKSERRRSTAPRSDDEGSLTRRDSAAWAAVSKTGLGGANLQRRRSTASQGYTSEGGSRKSSAAGGSRSSSGSSSSTVTAVPRRLGSQVSPQSRESSMTPSSAAPSPRVLAPSPAVAPSSATPRLPRSSTQPTLASADTGSIIRRPSKLSKSSLAEPVLETSQALHAPRVPSQAPPAPSATPSTPAGRPPRMRHSRTQSALADLGGTPIQRSRGFPSDLTRGALPGAPSNSPAPLSPARRVSSGHRPALPKGDMRSVEQKKNMLGQWLGNVDQLVQGVEKVGFWGSKV